MEFFTVLKNYFQFPDGALNIASYRFCRHFLSGKSTIQPSTEVRPDPTVWVAAVIPKLLKMQVQMNQAEIKDAIYKGVLYPNWILKPWLMTRIELLMALKELSLE